MEPSYNINLYDLFYISNKSVSGLALNTHPERYMKQLESSFETHIGNQGSSQSMSLFVVRLKPFICNFFNIDFFEIEKQLNFKQKLMQQYKIYLRYL